MPPAVTTHSEAAEIKTTERGTGQRDKITMVYGVFDQ